MSTPHLQLLPAVDVRAGRAVQLQQGVAGSGWDFGDPVQAALAWQEQGSTWSTLTGPSAPARMPTSWPRSLADWTLMWR